MVATAATPPTGAACRHCGAAMESAEARYCCSGCEMAAAIIDGAGLERYYAEREALPPRPGLMVQGFSRIATTLGPDGNVSIRLQIDGLRCASCVWVTERVLEQTPGVLDVSISYASGRANLRWNPQQTDLDQIAARISHLGYRPRPIDAAPTWDRALLLRLGVATFSAMNMMMLAISVYLGWWEGMDPRFAALFRWAALALATPVALWSAIPFYQGAWRGLQHRMLHMDLPVSLGIFVLYGHGVIATLLGQDAYLDSLGMLVMLLLIGRVLEQRGRQNAAAAAASLAAVVPQQVRRIQGSQIETVSPEQLQIGDVILVGAGEEIGADGCITSGTGNVRMALLTGESAPVAVKAGDRVVAGAALMEGSLQVAVEAVGAESLVGQMARGLQEAGDRPMEPALPDRIAPYFTGLTLLASVATFTGWYLHSGISDALTSTVSVLVVACPCALALSAPLSAAAGLGAAARRGLLLRSGDALRRLANVQDIALDKTGTLTGGALEVEEASPEGLRIAAALERESIHPVARAIVAEAIQQGIPLAQAEGVLETAGVGISGRVDGQLWSLGRGDAAGEVILNGPNTFVLRLRDRIRPDAARTVAALKRAGLRVVMLSGDHADVAAQVGASVGVDQAVGELSPAEKVQWIEQHPRPTLFVGDGLNDGPALRAAHVGIAMAGGAASSVLVADGIVAAAAVGPLLAGIRAARLSNKAVQSNLRRSLIYNFLAITAAAAGLVNPLVAALLMPLSSGMVIWGASRIEHQMQRFVQDDA